MENANHIILTARVVRMTDTCPQKAERYGVSMDLAHHPDGTSDVIGCMAYIEPGDTARSFVENVAVNEHVTVFGRFDVDPCKNIVVEYFRPVGG